MFFPFIPDVGLDPDLITVVENAKQEITVVYELNSQVPRERV